MNVKQKIDTAIRRIYHPWIRRVIERVEIQETDKFPTMATNGKQILVNPEFVKRLDIIYVTGALVHEALHIIQRHPLRRGDRDPERFNVACDHAINGMVFDFGYQLPDWALNPLEGSAEQIYGSVDESERPQQPQDQGNGQGQGQPSSSDTGDSGKPENAETGENGQNQADSGESNDSDGSGADESAGSEGGNSKPVSGQPGNAWDDVDLLDYPLEEGQTLADAHRELDALIKGAEMECDRAGDYIGGAERDAFEWQESNLNWPDELREFLQHIGGAEYTMNPPHTGLMASGIICNQLNHQGCGNVVLAIDTSGSINKKKLDRALTHLMMFLDDIDYESVRIIACNSKVTWDKSFYRGETVDITRMPKGGGTNFKPVFTRVAETETPDLLIYFTDMKSWDMDEDDDPGYPVVWLVDNPRHIRDGEWSSGAYSPTFGHKIDACQ